MPRASTSSALRPEILRAVTESGYTTPTPIQAQGHPRRPRGPRRHGRRPDRHRQDRRLRACRSCTGCMPQANTSPSPARHPVRALILAPTRELAIQVEEAIKDVRQVHRPALHLRVRRRRHQAATGHRARRRRDPRRHAGPPARSRRAEEREPVAGRDLRPRRGRPHARHGLHPRHQAHHGAAARRGEAAEPALLGDVLRTRSRSSPTSS